MQVFYFYFIISAKNLIVSSNNKRGRLLIRQSRIKRDPEHMGHPSPDDIDFEPNYPPHRLLSVPSQHIKIERHASEPAPSMTPPPSSSMHLLSLPQTPMLVKQHSHPLLPSQSTSCDTLSGHHRHLHHHHPLHRQLSYPTSETSYLIHSTSSSSIVLPVTTAAPVTTTPSTSPIPHYVATSTYKSSDVETMMSIRPPVLSKGPETITSIVVPETATLPPEHISIRSKNDDYNRPISAPIVSGIIMYLWATHSNCFVDYFISGYRASLERYQLRLDHSIVR